MKKKKGTTRDVIEVELDIGGYPVILKDTAGLFLFSFFFHFSFFIFLFFGDQRCYLFACFSFISLFSLSSFHFLNFINQIGLRETSNPIEGEGVRRAKEQVLFLFLFLFLSPSLFSFSFSLFY